MDAFKNFAKSTLASGITSGATSLSVATGTGVKFPAVPFNATIWDKSIPDPADDANVEVVRVTAIATDTLTITRAQEGTSAVAHNTGGKTYGIVAPLTAKTFNDINELKLTKTQTVVGTTNFATVTLSGSVDGASGVVDLLVVSDDGAGNSAVLAARTVFALALGNAGSFAVNTTPSSANRALAASNPSTFSGANHFVSFAVSGNVITIGATTSNVTGSQANATITMVIREHSGHTITAL